MYQQFKKTVAFSLLLVPIWAMGQHDYEKDFNGFWLDVKDHYAYLDKQRIAWNKVKEIYAPQAATVKSDSAFIRLLENVLNELYNGHNSLNTNLNSSNRLVPSGADMYVEKQNGKYIITDLRQGGKASKCGLAIGMELVQFNGAPIEVQQRQFLPKAMDAARITPAMHQYALDMLFAGTWNRPRTITVADKAGQRDFYPDTVRPMANDRLLAYGIIGQQVGYIKINNCLYNNDLIKAFDAALDSMLNTKGLILDLSETPSGGNATVARAIMGRFISKMMPYQRHEYDEAEYDTKRYWIEYVMPRKRQYKGQLVVTVSHWTGSMGEGMAIGFDAMKGVTVVGTPMAGLLGAIENFSMETTHIGFQIATERLYHVNGTARENYRPTVTTANSLQTWERAKALLQVK